MDTNSQTNSNNILSAVKGHNKISFNENKNTYSNVIIPNTNEKKSYFKKSKTFEESNDGKSKSSKLTKSQGLLDESNEKSDPNYQDFFNFLAFNSDLKKDFNDNEINILFSQMSNQTEKEVTGLINTQKMGRLNAVHRSSFKNNHLTTELKFLISSDSENASRKSRKSRDSSSIRSKNCPKKRAQSLKSVYELKMNNYKKRTTSGRNASTVRTSVQ
jgi:hypothetical protein